LGILKQNLTNSWQGIGAAIVLLTSGEALCMRGLFRALNKEILDHNTADGWLTSAYRTIQAEITLRMEQKRTGALMMISIDNLSMILSHYPGKFVDDMLVHLTQEIPLWAGNDSLMLRTQHDQFSLVLDYNDEPQLAELAEAIHIAMQRFACYLPEPVFVMASIGTAPFADEEADAIDIINHSYMAVHYAKEESPGVYASYARTKQHYQHTKEEMRKASELQRAIIEDRLRLVFQPVICSKTGEVSYYECLLRIVQNGLLISAGPYIEIAERMRLIDEIDLIVLGRVVEELKQHDTICLSFNVSNQAVDNPHWLNKAERLLADEAIASRVIVELTETGSQQDLRRISFFIASLQALGCQVALDDFGSGNTSFKQLKALPVDIIKIDGSFVKDMVENHDNHLFIKMILGFTTSFGLKTVAEFVETGEIAKSLMDLKVDYLQGHYFAAASPERPWLEGK
jgi:EAL domain-containing protein (putative c-di-GMP-specific phosphodiesterase class I)/GGDEF domain-containing protein